MPKKTIGRIDKVDFPTLDLFDIDVKIDTGAFTSSMHCHKVIEEDNLLKCLFFDKEHQNYNKKIIVFKNYTTTKVKSSNGMVQNRYMVKTSVLLFNKKYKIDLTLSTRSEMKYPILIGRKVLSKKFIVDINLKNLSHKQKKINQKTQN